MVFNELERVALDNSWTNGQHRNTVLLGLKKLMIKRDAKVSQLHLDNWGKTFDRRSSKSCMKKLGIMERKSQIHRKKSVGSVYEFRENMVNLLKMNGHHSSVKVIKSVFGSSLD